MANQHEENSVFPLGHFLEATMTNRRQFLQTTAAITGSFILPKNMFATSEPSFYFIHAETQTSWPISDPIQWSLQNAHEPILDRAADGLGKLTVNDTDRIIRLVLRRCSLNLLELQPDSLVVHHWGSHQADLKPFFKTNGLARPDIQVVLRDRKKEVTTTTTGDTFLYGVPIAPDFNLELFQSKWERRFEKEADDCQAVPNTNSGFAWEGLPDWDHGASRLSGRDHGASRLSQGG